MCRTVHMQQSACLAVDIDDCALFTPLEVSSAVRIPGMDRVFDSFKLFPRGSFKRILTLTQNPALLGVRN